MSRTRTWSYGRLNLAFQQAERHSRLSRQRKQKSPVQCLTKRAWVTSLQLALLLFACKPLCMSLRAFWLLVMRRSMELSMFEPASQGVRLLTQNLTLHAFWSLRQENGSTNKKAPFQTCLNSSRLSHEGRGCGFRRSRCQDAPGGEQRGDKHGQDACAGGLAVEPRNLLIALRHQMKVKPADGLRHEDPV